MYDDIMRDFTGADNPCLRQELKVSTAGKSNV